MLGMIQTGKRLLATGRRPPPVIESYATQRNSSGTGALTIPKPDGVAAGDLLVAILCTSNDDLLTWTVPGNWDKQAAQLDGPNLCIATRVADGSEGSGFSFSTDGRTGRSGSILRISGGLLDTVGSYGMLASAGALTAPSIVSAGGILVYAAGWRAGNYMTTRPAGMTHLLTYSSTPLPWITICTEEIASGATGDRSATFDATPGNAAAVLISIKSG